MKLIPYLIYCCSVYFVLNVFVFGVKSGRKIFVFQKKYINLQTLFSIGKNYV